ncbi:Pre-mRNA-splicing factor SYF1, partial [Cladochytrium tenue]
MALAAAPEGANPGPLDGGALTAAPATAAAAAATDAVTDRASALAELLELIHEDDFVYEQECVRNPYHLKNWTFYLEHKANSRDSYRGLVFIYERALQLFPGSYKLWKAYLDLRVSHVLQAPPDETTGMLKRKRALSDPEWQEVNGTFE